jgi:hypothetical protein
LRPALHGHSDRHLDRRPGDILLQSACDFDFRIEPNSRDSHPAGSSQLLLKASEAQAISCRQQARLIERALAWRFLVGGHGSPRHRAAYPRGLHSVCFGLAQPSWARGVTLGQSSRRRIPTGQEGTHCGHRHDSSSAPSALLLLSPAVPMGILIHLSEAKPSAVSPSLFPGEPRYDRDK